MNLAHPHNVVSATAARTGGQVLIDTLIAEGADLAFCVPGESFLAALDAMREVQDKFRMIVCRHEASATNMAEATGKLTGRPGVVFVTRGPGSSHAAIGIHTAQQDSTPLIVFVGQAARGHLEREAFQEVDYGQMYGKFAKWVVQIDDAARIPELVSRAFHVAVNGRPGPVVVAIPEDVLKEPCTSPVPSPFKRAVAAPGAASLTELGSMVAEAERPIVVVGGGGWNATAIDQVRDFAEKHHLPVAVGFRCQDLFDNSHPNYVGDLGLGIDAALADMVRKADLLIVVGERLGEASTKGYSLINIPRPIQKLIHVHPDPEELGRVYEGELLIAATVRDFAAALSGIPAGDKTREEWIQTGRAAYQKKIVPKDNGLPLDVGYVVKYLRDTLPDDAIIANGAGTYTGYVHRYYVYRRFRTQLAPTSGAMGYGFPAAVAAKILHPERTVVCFAGDGCFLMASQELATAIRYNVPVVIVLVNNSSYGSIRMHQERDYPGRVFATGLNNPDFVALAKAYGAYGETVATTEDFPAAFARAQASGTPALLELKIDIEVMVAANPRK
ncbi:thiamine pyrophosphate-binding protein [Sinorhizobium mexicanum]|uniref:Thiamine pyrophosphate-binding protein n=1 Tax=Sinorhizobium mexicanum TaxID=375549 RepID=A0A859QTX1_9HYPH|nr:thiamine pyrophosphate-binding protein [Sinorhizobium mexicanum]MBP1883778.1 acetolactate synthase-1/2/3 large subunit [Sinorhizobium mexicanum]QLL62949.1 thiamine pyrophosphate-binding protein [Sinorhizobium mexicanum]